MANLARPPEDRDPLPALIAGICDVALADMSHYAHLQVSERLDEQVAARQLGMVWPDQEGWGAVLNLSAVAILRQARQPEAAQRFLLFMADEAMQQRLAAAMDEYPVGLGIPLPSTLVALGAFKADLNGLAAPGQQPDAVQRVFQQAGWR
jgi:iron(III) transport system substrate-binding protein